VPRIVYLGPIAWSGADPPSWKSARTKPIPPEWQFVRVREHDKRTQSCQNGGLHGVWTVEKCDERTHRPRVGTGSARTNPTPRERTQRAEDRANEPNGIARTNPTSHSPGAGSARTNPTGHLGCELTYRARPIPRERTQRATQRRIGANEPNGVEMPPAGGRRRLGAPPGMKPGRTAAVGDGESPEPPSVGPSSPRREPVRPTTRHAITRRSGCMGRPRTGRRQPTDRRRSGG
jgi:hypothetical protein